MPRGRTNQPLVIWVYIGWYDRPEVLDLIRQGHEIRKVDLFGYLEEPDLILHPTAHRWSDDLWDYLPAALTMARARKRRTKA